MLESIYSIGSLLFHSPNNPGNASKPPESAENWNCNIIAVDLDDTLSSFRSAVQTETGVSPPNQRLFYKGTELTKNRNTLSELQLQDGDIIELQNPAVRFDQDDGQRQVLRLQLQALGHCLAKRAYKHAYILALRWEETDLPGLEEEVAQIRRTFGERGYIVEDYRIPMSDSASRLRRRLTHFCKYADSETLLMIFYTGHAIRDHGLNSPVLGSHNGKKREPALVPWTDIRGPICSAHSDMLIILDCCQAGGADPGNEDLDFPPDWTHSAFTKHIITASKWDRNAVPGLIPTICKSFSIWDKEWGPLTTRALYRAVKDRMAASNSRLSIWEKPKPQPTFDQLLPRYPSDQTILLPTQASRQHAREWSRVREMLKWD